MNENFSENIQPKFIKNILGLHGAKGEKWLEELPKIIERIERMWSLQIEKIFPNLSFNFVCSCVDVNSRKCVLKLGVPEKDASINFEYKALEAFNGKGAVKVLKFDGKLCAMLLERAVDGKTLHEVCGEDYEKAFQIAVEVMRKLPRNVPDKSKFINLDDWKNGLNRAAEAKFHLEKVSKAQKIFAELSEPLRNKILLHGDVHFDNILSAQREPFLLIDPKGIVGEIGFEIAVFLNDLANWTEHLPNRPEILHNAVESFSNAFGVSGENLRKWAYAFAVLSAWWMMEDFGDKDEKYILRAEIWKNQENHS